MDVPMWRFKALEEEALLFPPPPPPPPPAVLPAVLFLQAAVLLPSVRLPQLLDPLLKLKKWSQVQPLLNLRILMPHKVQIR